MAAILSRHNKNILVSKNTTVNHPCNCRRKTEYLLNGESRKKTFIYKANISTDDNDAPKYCYGCWETEFKSDFHNRRQSLKSEQKNTTELSKAFLEAIDNKKNPRIK